jgi:hypothetical protein
LDPVLDEVDGNLAVARAVMRIGQMIHGRLPSESRSIDIQESEAGWKCDQRELAGAENVTTPYFLSSVLHRPRRTLVPVF